MGKDQQWSMHTPNCSLIKFTVGPKVQRESGNQSLNLETEVLREVHFLPEGIIGNGNQNYVPKTTVLPSLLLLLKHDPQLGHRTMEVQISRR